VRRRTLGAAVGGVTAGLACWGSDLLSLSRLRLAGVSDAAAQSDVVAAARTALLAFELRLALTQALLGAALGLLTLACWPGRRAASPRAAALRALAAVLAVETLAAGAMMARYPQLYSDSWWRAGGWRASIQRIVTHVLGPVPFDIALGVLASVALGLAVWRLRRQVSPSRRALLALAAVAVIAAWSGFGRDGSTSVAAGASPDILVLAVDSLRSDRVPGEAMPFVASLVRSGSLFRFAFTPVAHTFPSWVSTLTGREPREHGVRSMFPGRASVQSVGRTLFGELRDDGYRTFVASHFAGDVFRRFDAGFETVDAPELTVDTLATSTALSAHATALPLLRWSAGRKLFPEWRNVPQLDDPEWLVDATLEHLRRSRRAPVAGLVFFGTAHFPYVAPYPFYRAGSGDYRGSFLYDVPPSRGEEIGEADVRQAQARYDGALTAVDHAIERLCSELAHEGRLAHTLLVVTGDHGEALFEHSGLAGHGDALEASAQSVPILLLGPGVPRGRVSDSQVRLFDLPATLLRLVHPERPATFGAGSSLLAEAGPRPACVETAPWFWPDAPRALRGDRLVYEPISQLLEIEPGSRAIVLRPDRSDAVEDAKDRGIVLGNRLWHQRATPRGIRTELITLPGVTPEHAAVDLPGLFLRRCVEGDPELETVLGAVVHRSHQAAGPSAAGPEGCAQCGLGR
jgi:arylsulfatase A-like enzyme